MRDNWSGFWQVAPKLAKDHGSLEYMVAQPLHTQHGTSQQKHVRKDYHRSKQGTQCILLSINQCLKQPHIRVITWQREKGCPSKVSTKINIVNMLALPLTVRQ